MYNAYKDRVNFLFVYIREAHPADGWVSPLNERDGIRIDQPTTCEERAQVANLCTVNLKVTVPTVVDTIDDEVATAYSAFPDRIYIVNAEGNIGYKGRPGPAGFDVPEAQTALDQVLETGLAETPADGGEFRRRRFRRLPPWRYPF